MILELFPRTRAIPAVKECWHLPETDTNDLELEDDGALLELMIAGEERGFVALYRKYHALVYRFALQVSGICHIAEDVTQETRRTSIKLGAAHFCFTCSASRATWCGRTRGETSCLPQLTLIKNCPRTLPTS